MYKLLIVDDEHLITEGLAQGIDWTGMGFEISGMVFNGLEALKFIEHTRPDVILTDIKMPFMDGIELIRSVKLIDSQISFVILSGYDDFGYAKKAIEYGIVSYLLKPLKEDEISEVFRKLFLKLENKKAMDNQYSRIRERLDNNKYVIFGNLLMKLINGELQDINIFRREISDIGVNLCEEYICFIAFCFDVKDKSEDNKLKNQLILHEAIDFWADYKYPVFTDSEKFFIVANSSIIIDIWELKRAVEMFRKHIEERNPPLLNNVILSFGLGSSSRLFNNLNKSMWDSVAALKYRFFNGYGHIIHYSEIQGKDNIIIENGAVVRFINDLDVEIIKGTQSDIHAIISLFFEDVLYKSFCDSSWVYMRLVEIYLLLINKIEERGIHIKAMKSEEVYNYFKAACTFTEVISGFSKLIIELCEQVSLIKSSCNNILIFEVKNYINKYYYKKISLQELSDTFFINPSYLSTLFKKETKENISDYTQKVRIENAKTYLKELKSPIQEIAEMTGFTDYRYFCCVFKKTTGVSPLQYRMKLIQN
ncbi:MAG: response regulator [Ruminiclostridium sp.]|nr:response regulator [Ruminiclostridium sp.]